MTGLATTAALLLALGAAPLGPPTHTGYAVYYAEGVMDGVAEARHIAPRPCMVAYTYARDADMGRLWLRVAGPAGMVDCLVTDLPRPRDRRALIRRDIVVELNWESRWVCGRGWSGRARDCLIEAWVLSE